MPKLLIHEDEIGYIWVKPDNGNFGNYDEIGNSLNDAYLREKGKHISFDFQGFTYLKDKQKNIFYTNGEGVGKISLKENN